MADVVAVFLFLFVRQGGVGDHGGVALGGVVAGLAVCPAAASRLSAGAPSSRRVMLKSTRLPTTGSCSILRLLWSSPEGACRRCLSTRLSVVECGTNETFVR